MSFRRSADAEPTRARGRSALAKAAIVLEVVLGVGAVGGGLALILGPNGQIIPLPVALLNSSPFASYFWPGLILFAVLGIGPLLVAVTAWRRWDAAPLLTIGVAAVLLIWMTVEILIIGYSNNPPLQPLYLALGIAIGFVGVAWRRHDKSLAAVART